MNPAFWVYLSTIIFVSFVVLKSYKLIGAFFLRQQKEIKSKLNESEEVFQQAQDLYEDYREKMEKLEIEADKILVHANQMCQNIGASTDEAVERIVHKKKFELERHVEAFKIQKENEVISKYADLIIGDVHHSLSTKKSH